MSTINSSASILPSNIEAEKTVLGTLILNTSHFQLVVESLTVKSFYHAPHRVIYQVILDLMRDYKHLNMNKVIAELRKRNKLEDAGGEMYLYSIQEECAPKLAVKEYVKAIREAEISRDVIAYATNIISNSRDLDSEKRQEEIKKLLDYIHKQQTSSKRTYIELQENIQMTLEDIFITKRAKLSTPFKLLNELLGGGFGAGEMVVIGARPSMGKTALIVTMILDLILRNRNVGFISAEMNANAIMKRQLAQMANCSYSRIESMDSGKQEDVDMMALLAETLQKGGKYAIETSTVYLSEVTRSARMMKENLGIEILFIDYLQRLTVGGKIKEYQEMTFLSSEIKTLANELNIPIVVLSQLNRSVENRVDRRPYMSDLRESGGIEQDADVIMLMYKESYYEPECQNPNNVEINIAKNRNGRTGKVDLYFDPVSMKFEDYSSDDTRVEIASYVDRD